MAASTVLATVREASMAVSASMVIRRISVALSNTAVAFPALRPCSKWTWTALEFGPAVVAVIRKSLSEPSGETISVANDSDPASVTAASQGSVNVIGPVPSLADSLVVSRTAAHSVNELIAAITALASVRSTSMSVSESTVIRRIRACSSNEA